jgi:tetratricopeptide (TPR) repeat protein
MDLPGERLSDALSRESIRAAFRAWGSAKKLNVHPLTELDVVRVRQHAAGYSHTPFERGLALRETLRAAIEAIRPADGEPEPSEKRWRPYVILTQQFLHGRTPDCIATDLNISRRTFYIEQQQAMEKVAEILCQWEEEAYLDKTVPMDQPDSAPASAAKLEHAMPFMVPPRPPNTLVGRDALLAELRHRLLESQDMSLTALQGLPGVGKTTLAIELAHDLEIRARFHDGVLWVGLGRQPDVLALLGGWAAALKVPTEDIARHTSLAERVRAIHTAIGTRHMLLVIDDAWQIGDALAFKVGGPNCAHLVTTRLASIAIDFAGERTTTVRELNATEGVSLLAQLAPRVVNAEPEEARALVQAVGGLPLALILMGGHLRRQSHGAQTRRLYQALAQLQETEARLRLAQPQSPLEQQHSLMSDGLLSLQASIGLSDAALDTVARQALRDLSLFPPKPNTFSEAAALAVANMPAETLDRLVDHGLVECVGGDRYTLHQTIADYARAAAAESAVEAKAAARLVAYFVQYVGAHADDYKVLDLELSNLQAALQIACERQMDTALIQGANALFPFLVAQGLYVLAERYLHQAHQAALTLGSPPELVVVLHSRGIIAVKRGQYAEAEGYFDESLALAQAAQLRREAAESLRNLGLVSEHRGDYARALGYLEQALHAFREIDDRYGENQTLNNLGIVSADQGDYTRATRYFQDALRFWRESGDRHREDLVLSNLGAIYYYQSDFVNAAAYCEQSLRIKQEMGDRAGEGQPLFYFGKIAQACGDYRKAKAYGEQALTICREIGDRHGEGEGLAFLALVCHQLGDDQTAWEHSRQAQRIMEAVGDRDGQGTTLTCLGRVAEGLGNMDVAATAYRQALDLRQSLEQAHLVIDPLAGLARVDLARGNLAQAQSEVEAILSCLEANPLDGVEEPLRAHLTCYQVLCANHDRRARDVLTAGYNLLQERAAKISDETLRRSFLENVPAHRELLAIWGNGG